MFFCFFFLWVEFHLLNHSFSTLVNAETRSAVSPQGFYSRDPTPAQQTVAEDFGGAQHFPVVLLLVSGFVPACVPSLPSSMLDHPRVSTRPQFSNVMCGTQPVSLG
jgi:hypothetical protein